MSEDRLHPDFPTGEKADVLWKVRETLYKAATEAGYEVIGCGIGCGPENTDGSADIGLKVDGRRVEINIYLPRDKQ